jgi:neurofibromin 1
VLHRFLDRHADKIGKELLSMSRPAPEGDASALDGKRAWDDLCALLVDLGSPVAVPQLPVQDMSELREYSDLMNRYNDQSTTSVEKFFLETPANDWVSSIIILICLELTSA